MALFLFKSFKPNKNPIIACVEREIEREVRWKERWLILFVLESREIAAFVR